MKNQHKDYFAEKYSNYSYNQKKHGKELVDLVIHKNNEVILDLGCGSGETTLRLAESAAKYQGSIIGVDPDISRINIAKKNCPDVITNVDYRVLSGTNLKTIEDKSVDTVFSSMVFSWIEDKKKLFSEIYRCLKPSGVCIFKTIQDYDRKMFNEIVFLDKKFQTDNIPYNYFFSQEDLEHKCMFKGSGFKILSLECLEDVLCIDSYNSFISYIEGTLQGYFSYVNVSNKEKRRLELKYPESISFGYKYVLGIFQKK
jgi:ubiquinone/menaquinone biosynthesis C-methylase UbiE